MKSAPIASIVSNENTMENLTNGSNANINLSNSVSESGKQNECSSTENQSETNIHHSAKTPRKASMRIAEAAKTKEAMLTSGAAAGDGEIPSSNVAKSSTSLENETVNKLNETGKQLRPRPPKRVSNESNSVNIDSKTGLSSNFVFKISKNFLNINKITYMKKRS